MFLFFIRQNAYVCSLILAVGLGGSLSFAEAQMVAETSSSEASAGPPREGSYQAGLGQRLTIQSTNLESLLLEKGVITQEDWIHLKAEEERRIFEQTTEMQMAGNPRWYERIRLNGYAQFRYNLGATDG